MEGLTHPYGRSVGLLMVPEDPPHCAENLLLTKLLYMKANHDLIELPICEGFYAVCFWCEVIMKLIELIFIKIAL
jgi:hypothetical protein